MRSVLCGKFVIDDPGPDVAVAATAPPDARPPHLALSRGDRVENRYEGGNFFYLLWWKRQESTLDGLHVRCRTRSASAAPTPRHLFVAHITRCRDDAPELCHAAHLDRTRASNPRRSVLCAPPQNARLLAPAPCGAAAGVHVISGLVAGSTREAHRYRLRTLLEPGFLPAAMASGAWTR
jgi:hypothetical protein